MSVSPVPAERFPHEVADLNDSQLERFARHLSLAGFGTEAQLALLRSRVLVVGAGGLGAPVLTYLAAAGVGEIHVVDDDVVERSNLHRQVIHGESDLGEAKTASAARRMRELHPEIQVVEHRERMTAVNALELVDGMDLVVDGADNFATRYLVADACEIAGMPVVWGAILRFAGQVALFAPGAAQYRDVFPEEPEPGEVPSCAAAGVLGVLPGIVGSIMAAEAIKYLTGVGETLVNRLLSVDALTWQFSTLRLTPDPQRSPVTELNGDEPETAGEDGRGERAVAEGEIPAATLRAWLQDPDQRRTLRVLDVREGWERRLRRLPVPSDVGESHAPVAEVAHAAAQLSPEPGTTLVVYCAAGARSAQAREDLVAAGARPESVLSLAGGLSAYE